MFARTYLPTYCEIQPNALKFDNIFGIIKFNVISGAATNLPTYLGRYKSKTDVRQRHYFLLIIIVPHD